ncbi:hypothetical protein M9458_041591, partial [Cirrhinus mrigala]
MGNILYCCRKVSEFINTKGVGNQTEEQSLLLSQENSDIESLSPSRTSADLLASPVLDQDHLLFPDIVLSSNLRVREDSIQPLELLLATRGEAQDVRRDGVYESNLRNGGERNRELVGRPSTNIAGINQLCSTEDEWPLLSSLYQIPAAQNRICTHGLEADACKPHGMGLFEDITVSRNSVTIPVLGASSSDASQSDADISQREDGWTQKEQFTEREEPKEQLRVKKLLNEPNSAAQTPLDAMKMQPAYGIPIESPLEAQTLELIAQPDDFEDPDALAKPDSQTSETLEMDILKREHANEKPTTSVELPLCMEKKISHVEQPDITDMSSGLVEHELGEMEQNLSQMDQDLMWKKKEVEHMQWDLEALKQSTGLALRDSEQKTLAVTQVEQREDQTERFTLFVVDKLFLATPNLT